MMDTELLEKLREYGADTKGINDRFLGNLRLYESCMGDFLKEENFGKLERALEEKDYAAAFEGAHALKGLSGNMGLTPFYESVCTLVESLRAGDYSRIEPEYAAVKGELEALEKIFS